MSDSSSNSKSRRSHRGKPEVPISSWSEQTSTVRRLDPSTDVVRRHDGYSQPVQRYPRPISLGSSTTTSPHRQYTTTYRPPSLQESASPPVSPTSDNAKSNKPMHLQAVGRSPSARDIILQQSKGGYRSSIVDTSENPIDDEQPEKDTNKLGIETESSPRRVSVKDMVHTLPVETLLPIDDSQGQYDRGRRPSHGAQREDVIKFEQGRIRALQEERLHIQKKTFTKWMNSFLQKARMEVEDLFTDLADGKKLLKLLEIISGEKLGKPNNGKMRVHKVENLNKSLAFLQTKKVRLESIGAEDIVDGNPRLILGLIWTIILRFQIQEIEIDVDEDNDTSEKRSAKDALLLWCQRKTNGYPGVAILDFTGSWRNGLGFNALIHAHRPDLVKFETLSPNKHIDNLNNAFDVAHNELGIPRLLDAEDVDTARPDEKSILTYVASYYHTFARMKNELKSGRRIANIIGQMMDADRKKELYERLTTDLMNWIRSKVIELEDRKFPNSLEGIQGELLRFKQYRTMEKPPKYKERSEIEALYFHVNTLLKALNQPVFTPSEGRLVQELQKAWETLESAEHRREVALREELLRQEKLEQLHYKFMRKSVLREGYAREMIQVLSDSRYGNNLQHVDATVKKHEAIGADILARKERFEDLRAMSSELSRENYHGSAKVLEREAEITAKWEELLALLEKHKKSLSTQSNLMAALREIDTLTGTIQELQSHFQSQGVGEHLLAVEDLLQKHALQELQVTACGDTLTRLRRHGQQFTQANILQEKLANLDKEYARLVQSSEERRSRLEDARNLFQFIQDHEEEESWLIEKQRICTAAITAKDLRAVLSLQQKHKALQDEMKARKPKSEQLRQVGQRLVDESHPRSGEIRTRLESLQLRWKELQQLADTRKKQLEDAAEAHQFYTDANETESWLKEKMALVNSTDYGLDEPSAQALLGRLKALNEEIKAYKGDITSLNVTAAKLIELGVSNLDLADEADGENADGEEWRTETRLVPQEVWEDEPYERTETRTTYEMRMIPQVKSLYPFSGQGMEMTKGEIMFLLSKTNQDWWNVKKQNGFEGFVPANYVKEVEAKPMSVPVEREEKIRDVRKVQKTKMVRQTIKVKKPKQKAHTVNGQSDGGQTIERRQKAINDTYEELLQLSDKRRLLLEDAIRLYGFYKECDDFEKWIKDKEKLLRSDDTSTENVETAKRKYENFLTDLSASGKRIDAIDQAVDEFKKQGHSQIDKVKARQRQIHALWDKLNRLKAEKEKNLEGASSVQVFNRTCDEARDWMSEKMQQLDGAEHGPDLKTVQALQRRHLNLERELAPVEEKVNRVNLLAESVKAAYPHESNNVKTRQAEVQALWNKVKNKARDRRARLEDAVGQQVFMNSAENLLNWTETTKEAINNRPAVRDIATAEALQKAHSEIQDDIRAHEDEWQEVMDLGNTLYERNPSSEQIKTKLMEMVEAHEDLIRVAQEQENWLQQCRDLQCLTREADQIDASSSAHEAVLANSDLGNSLDDVKALEKRHQDLEKTLTAQDERVSAFCEKADEMIRKHHYDSPNIAKRRKQVLLRRQSVKDLAEKRREALLAAENFQELTAKVQDLRDWVSEKMKIAGDESYRDLTNLKRKLQKHEAFERELKANEQQLRLLKKSDVGQYRSADVTQMLDQLTKEWDTLVALSRDKGRRLRQAAAEHAYNRTLEDAREKVEELRTTLSSNQTGTDLRDCKHLLKKHQLLEQELSTWQVKVADLVAEGNAMAQDGHFDADAILKAGRDCQKRFEELNTPASVRRSLLEESLRFHKYNFELDAKLQWVREHKPLTELSTLGQNLHQAQALQKKHKKLEAEIAGHQTMIDKTLANGKDLINQNHPQSKDIEKLSKILETEWADLGASAQERAKKLELSLKAQEFFFEAEEVESWLSEKQDVLNSTDYGRDRDAASKLLAKHKALELELDSYNGIISEMQHTAEKMVSAKHPDAKAIAARQQILSQQMKQLQKLATTRQSRLMESMYRHEYFLASAELEQWIKEQMITATSEEYGHDYEHLLLLRSKFDDWKLRKEVETERFNQCKELAEKLMMADNQTSPYAEDVEKRQEELAAAWQKLQEQMRVREQRLDAAGEIHRFHRDVADALSRIQEKAAALSDDTGRDLNSVVALIKRHEGFEHDLVVLEAQLQFLIEDGTKLQGKFAGQNAAQIATQQEKVVQQWSDLQQRTAQRQDILNASYHLQKFISEARDLITWSSGLRASMMTEEKISDAGSAQTVKTEHDAMKAEIEAREDNFQRVLQLAQQLEEDQSPAVKQEVQDKLSALLEERQRLHSAWHNKKIQLDQLIDLHFFLREAKQITTTTSEQETMLSADDVTGLDVDEVAHAVKKHDAFEKLIATQEERVNGLHEHGSKLLEQNHFESPVIKQHLADVVTRRKRINDLCRMRRRRLGEGLLHAQFMRDVAEASAWVAERQKRLDADVLNSTGEEMASLEEKIKKLQKHQAFQAEIVAHEPRIKGIKEQLDRLVSEKHAEANSAKSQWAALHSSWRKLLSDSDNYSRGLEEAQDILEFHNQVDKIEAWIREKEVMVHAGESGNDYEHCLALQRRLDDVDSDMRVDDQRIKNIYNLADKLIRQGRTDTELVKSKRDHLAKKWQGLQGALAEYRERLAGALEVHGFNRDVDDTSSRVAEKSAAVQSNDLGRDLAAAERLQRRQEAFERDMTAIEGKIKEHEATARVLTKRYPEMTAPITDKLTILEGNWKKLLALSETRRQMLQDVYKKHKFQADLRDLESWVQETVERMKNQALPTTIADAEASIQLHDERKAEIDGRKETFKMLREIGNEDDRLKLKELEDQLEDAWQERRQALNRALELAKFIGHCDETERWLSNKEAFVNNDDLGDSIPAVDALIQKHDAFEKTVAAQTSRVDELAESAKLLCGDKPDKHDAAITERLRSVIARRDKLKNVSEARRLKLLDTRQFLLFLRNVYEVQGWLHSKLQIANDENYRDPSNLKSKIQKHSTFQAELQVNRTRVENVVSEGQKLRNENHFASDEITSQVDELERLWTELTAATEDKRQKLADAYEGMMFLRSVEAIEDWMNDMEGLLSSEDHGRDLTGVSHLLRRHADLEKDMIERGDEVDRLKSAIAKFEASEHFMLEEMTTRFNAALKRYYSLQKPIQIRRENLEDSLQLHQFMGDVDEELQWLEDKEPALSSDDLGTSLTIVQNLQKKHQVLESELQTRGPVVSALESRAMQMTRNKHFAASNIEVKIKDLRVRFDRANNLASVRRLRLLDAVESQTFYAEAVDAIAWMKDKRPPLVSTYLGKDEDTADGLIKKLQTSKRDLDAFQTTIQRLQKLSQGLVERHHFDSDNITQKQNELETLYKELLQLADTRQQKLTDSRKYFGFLRDCEEIAEWIHEHTALAASEDYGADAEHVEILIKNFDTFVASVNGTESRVKDCMSKGKVLLNENNHEAENIRLKIKETKGMWDDLKELAHARQEALNGAKEVHMFDRTADETMEWMGEKQAALSYGDAFGGAGQDLQTIQALVRKHEAFASELEAVRAQVTAVDAEAARLLERFPDTSEHVYATRDAVATQWRALLDAAATRRSQLTQSEQLQTYFDHHRDLMAWLNEMLAKITAPDLAQDVAAAENLISRHKEHHSEIDARADELQKFYVTGEQLVCQGHFLADDVREKINALQSRHRLLIDTWLKRKELYEQNLDTQIFKRDADLLESWLVSREPILRDPQLGKSITQAEELLRKHDDFEKTIEAQEDKCTALQRITLLERSFQAQKEAEMAAKQAERERLDREKVEARKRKEVQRITDERRKEDERRKQVEGRTGDVNGSASSPEPNRLQVPGSPQLQKSGSLSQLIVGDRIRRDMKRAESMKVDAKKPKRTPSFTTRRRTQSFRKLQKLDQLPPLEIEGILDRKQELQSGGKRAPVRSWKTFYTVLCGQLLCFFKDVEDFGNSKAASSPISILKARCEKAEDYTKRKYVFRLTCTDGSEYLFLANTSEEMSDWVKKIKFHADLPPSLQLLSYDESQKKSIEGEVTNAGDISSGGSSRASTPEPSSPVPQKPTQTQTQFLAQNRPPIPPRTAPPAVPVRQRTIEGVDVRDGPTRENGATETWRRSLDTSSSPDMALSSPPPLPVSQPPPPHVQAHGGVAGGGGIIGPYNLKYASLPPLQHPTNTTNHHPHHHNFHHQYSLSHSNSSSFQRHEAYHQQWTDGYYNQSYGNLPSPVVGDHRSSVSSNVSTASVTVDRRASESSSENELPTAAARSGSQKDKQSESVMAKIEDGSIETTTVNNMSSQSNVSLSAHSPTTAVPLEIPHSGLPSPNPSPKLSPKSTTNQQQKKEATPTQRTNNSATAIGYREPSPNIHDSKVDTTESVGNISRSSDSNPPEFVRSTSQECPKDVKDGKERKESRGSDRTKKKSAWYHALTPTYKSRSEEFKRYFKDLPLEERLIVDYSCAAQKDILVQGRLYATQNYVCFYANYFRWETCVCIKWKDVTAVTKEKTAIFIPNAISISTKTDKHLFSTFNTRDKAYVTLFRIWQNSLIDEPINPKTMWEWVREAYGEELGLSSDDEYYDKPVDISEPSAVKQSIETLSEHESKIEKGTGSEVGSSATESTHKSSLSIPSPPKLNADLTPSPIAPDTQLPTDLSDTTESDVDRSLAMPPSQQQQMVSSSVTCTTPHEGRCLVNVTLPCTVDQLFTLLFTHSKFFLEFHALRRTADIKASSWQPNGSPDSGEKLRNISMLVALSQTIGPRTASVSETQIMQACSKPGWLYSIDGEVVNAGIPYCDSFYVEKHYCLTRTGSQECNFSVYAQLKYKKAVFVLVKNVIEKNTWSGLDDFYESLIKAINVECEELNPKVRKQRRRQHRGAIKPVLLPVDDMSVSPSRGASVKRGGSAQNEKGADILIYLVLAVLILLVILNGMLYYKLWRLEAWGGTPTRNSVSQLDFEILRNPPKTPEAWIDLYKKQESLHREELMRWKTVLEGSVKLLRQAEEALTSLHTPTTNSYQQNQHEHEL